LLGFGQSVAIGWRFDEFGERRHDAE
jgi:hypothetical protein